jgi:hypothetical protein
MDVHVLRLLVALDSDSPDNLIAENFGISRHEVADLRRWRREEREAVCRWLLRS